MILDTSAVIAILQNESGSDRLITEMEKAGSLKISAASVVEAGIVMLSRYGDAGEIEVEQFIHQLGVKVIPVTEAHAELARSAYRKFGKGRHPAGLNFGDCFAYALAISLHEPLLFTGEDFSKTDVLIPNDN
jgi:ribonuclease VapC